MGREHALEGDGRSLPEPTPELVLIRVFVRAHLRSCHLKGVERKEAFIRESETEFALMAHAASIPHLRASAYRLKELRAEELALEWYRSKYSMLAG